MVLGSDLIGLSQAYTYYYEKLGYLVSHPPFSPLKIEKQIT